MVRFKYIGSSLFTGKTAPSRWKLMIQFIFSIKTMGNYRDQTLAKEEMSLLRPMGGAQTSAE
jgi:hypothetical protein